mmetsp:Transcript_30363/g.42025  ORF Transcript_30363/g.42025 Transcript_30363/m.42025 type:complete len:209 (+) Transcript_30363:1-627(+)
MPASSSALSRGVKLSGRSFVVLAHLTPLPSPLITWGLSLTEIPSLSFASSTLFAVTLTTAKSAVLEGIDWAGVPAQPGAETYLHYLNCLVTVIVCFALADTLKQFKNEFENELEKKSKELLVPYTASPSAAVVPTSPVVSKLLRTKAAPPSPPGVTNGNITPKKPAAKGRRATMAGGEKIKSPKSTRKVTKAPALEEFTPRRSARIRS